MTLNLIDLFSATYQDGGRGPRSFDCFGLFIEIQRRRGIDLSDLPSPGDRAARAELFYDRVQEWKRLDSPKPYCGVAFRVGRYVSHIGVVLEDCQRFMHVDEGIGVAVERLDAPRWEKRVAGFYEYA